jgi:hypothetical protein
MCSWWSNLPLPAGRHPTAAGGVHGMTQVQKWSYSYIGKPQITQPNQYFFRTALFINSEIAGLS